jgi:hypothetical protein
LEQVVAKVDNELRSFREPEVERMTVTFEIPDQLAGRLGPDAARMSHEALGLEAHRQGLWTEAERERQVHRELASS